MAERKKTKNSKGSQAQPNPTSTSVGSFNVGENIDKGVVVIGNNNVVQYASVIEKNIEKHEPDYWALKHPYPMPKNFTGRIAERATLTHWLKEDSENSMFILRALGGFGKSALSWQWLTHDVKPENFPKVLWWSFYEGDASFEHFIEETLKYLKLEVPQGQRPQVDELLKAMQGQKILLIIDGFERALRAYSSMNAAYQDDGSAPAAVLGGGDAAGSSGTDCVNINAEIFLKSVCSLPNIKSKVLMTTRLTPRAVKSRGEFMLGCREVELTAMQPADAVEFFRKQKIKGIHAEIEAACAPYGYHPLSLRLLAGRILKDFENPADIVVAQKLKIDGDIIQQKHHVLEVSYNSLPQHEQKLLSTIACFRSPVELETIQSIVENKDTLDSDLHDLVTRSLLHFDEKTKTFDLHPIVRRYAYNHWNADERIKVHTSLQNYFATMMISNKDKDLDGFSHLIELYHHTLQTGDADTACLLYYQTIWKTVYYQRGLYQLQIELLKSLFIDGDVKKTRLIKSNYQAWVLNELGSAYSMSGQPYQALEMFEYHNKIQENKISKQNLAVGLGNISSFALMPIGALRLSETNLKRCIQLSKESQSTVFESMGHQELGRLRSYLGSWAEADKEFSRALKIQKKNKHLQPQVLTWSYQSLSLLLQARNPSQFRSSHIKLAIQAAQSAFNLAQKQSQEAHSVERDFVQIYLLLGVAFRLSSQLDIAEQHLVEALSRCRGINNVESETDIVLDLARLRYDQKNYEEAKNLAEEALTITERCGYVLQGADVNLFLAQYALEQEKDKAKAKQYAETALKLAYCDGPPYYYKVAYEEAERMLKDLA